MDLSTYSTSKLDDTQASGSHAAELKRALDAHEATRQELHEARRNYQTALDIQQHLAAELEQHRTTHDRSTAELNAKLARMQEELGECRAARITDSEQHERAVNVLEDKIRDLEDKVTLRAERDEPVVNQTSINTDETECARERDALQVHVREQERAIEESRQAIASLKEQLTALSEQLTCSRGNLTSKKEELESATEALHATQAELAMASAEVQRLKSEGNNHAAKGNSLFAEVEDKRQEMAKTLIQMKQHNVQLKRDLANKQAEIDTLLCEKKTLWEEYTGMAGHHDAELIKSYEQRITDLANMVEHQRKELVRWFSKYYEPGTSQATEWVGGVLAHLKERCLQLSEELSSTSIDNLSKASQIRDLHKQVASWRLKSLEATTTIAQLEKTLKEISHNSAETQKLEVCQKQSKNVLRTINTQNSIEKLQNIENKENIKWEMQDSLEKETNGLDKSVLKREKTVSDVKKKVTF